MILAAGRGERMRPLSEHTPKPLLTVAGQPLIVRHLERLAAAGVREVVINTAHLGEQFPAALGDGARWDLRIRYSHEGEQALETGGGILKALPLLGDEPFIAVSGDLWTDYDFTRLRIGADDLAHLVMVRNPDWHVAGDFGLERDRIVEQGGTRMTYANIAVYRPALFTDWHIAAADEPGVALDPPRFRLLPLYRAALRHGHVSGEAFDGRWHNLGTPQQLAELDAALRAGDA
jgi:MurNAc alpha-1-phosphate uridylyltransferase